MTCPHTLDGVPCWEPFTTWHKEQPAAGITSA